MKITTELSFILIETTPFLSIIQGYYKNYLYVLLICALLSEISEALLYNNLYNTN